MRALVDAVRRTPSVAVIPGLEARRLLVADGRIAGVLAAGPAGAVTLPASRVVIATGGIGGLYRHTTNPLGALGQGLALAARAGAVLADMEFVQFHPTALDVGRDPMPLVSEAVRGEGAVLVDETAGAFMADELRRRARAARPGGARGLALICATGHRVFLDARRALGDGFAARFPAIAAHCRAAGIDPARAPIPVRPAAHYHMGGIAVDGAGRSTVAGLWACGEAPSTGLHGANRLASNSLLEAAVCGALGRRRASTRYRPERRRAPRPPPTADRPPSRPVRQILSPRRRAARRRRIANADRPPLSPPSPSLEPAADAGRSVGLSDRHGRAARAAKAAAAIARSRLSATARAAHGARSCASTSAERDGLAAEAPSPPMTSLDALRRCRES